MQSGFLPRDINNQSSLENKTEDVSDIQNEMVNLLRILVMHQEQVTGLTVTTEEIEHVNND